MSEAAPTRDRLGIWCGWVLAVAAALTPLFAWLGPLGFAPLVGLAGLLCLPALRGAGGGLAAPGLLLALAAWAVLSRFWSPFSPDELEDSTALKLSLQLLLYWAAICGARRADPATARLALQIGAFGLAGYSAVLLVEAFTQAGIYRALRVAIDDPITLPYAGKNLAQGAFVLALLWPVAAAAGARAGAPIWLALVMAIATAVGGYMFLADAPVLAVGLALSVLAAVTLWPTGAPRQMGVLAALAIVAMPLVVVAMRMLGLGPQLPLSWSQRVGYWNHAIDRIGQHPWRGWGLDASRTFGPDIQLHPHNGALQLWLELGVPGVALGALAWALIFRRLAQPERSLLAAAGAASAAVYLLFGLVSFGVWQEWWLALGAWVAVIMALGQRAAADARARSGMTLPGADRVDRPVGPRPIDGPGLVE
jgi:O-antigen ligase